MLLNQQPTLDFNIVLIKDFKESKKIWHPLPRCKEVYE
jgi:hypothetical protein